MPFVTLLAAILAETIATASLKASAGFTRLWPSGYGLAFYLLSLTLRTIPVGIAYAIWSGVGIVLIGLIGWALFGQRPDEAGFIGIGLILAGVLVLQLFSHTGTRP
jgi:small multidrug resistance pump